MRLRLRQIRALLIVGVIVISTGLWVAGLLKSPIMHPEVREAALFTRRYISQHAPELKEEKELAEAYWQRYPDIRADRYYGVDGVMGIRGPREHFRQHGKREGRIYGVIITPADMELEQKYAEAYWQRYPALEKSRIWGRQSALGVLGPRDHYHYIGRHQGLTWEL